MKHVIGVLGLRIFNTMSLFHMKNEWYENNICILCNQLWLEMNSIKDDQSQHETHM